MNKLVPYEISLWRNEDRYIVKVGETYQTVSSLAGLSNFTLVNEYVKEIKIGVIGSNEYKSPIHCNEIQLTQNVNGTNTLIFTMFQHYLDDETFEMKENPYIGYLSANTHIKMRYDYVRDDNGAIMYDTDNNPIYQWYDFLVQNINESQENNKFVYTCNDLYINELSKNGYNVELDTELENNMGSALTLSESILNNTEWRVIDYDGVDLEDGRHIESDFLKASTNEALYVYTLSEAITAYVVDDFTYQNHSWTKGQAVTIPAEQMIYISATGYLNKTTPILFLWNDPNKHFTDKNGGDTTVIVDDNGTILSSPNYQVASLPDYSSSALFVSDRYRGDMLLTNMVTKYVPDIDEFCGQYTRTEYYHVLSDTTATPERGVAYFTRTDIGSEHIYTVWNEDHFEAGVTYYILNRDSTGATDSTTVLYYSYSEYEYASLASTQQLIANNTNLSNYNAWDSTKTTVTHYTPVSEQGTVDFEKTVLTIKFSDNDQTLGECYNTGIEGNKAVFTKGFVKDEIYWCAVKCPTSAEQTYITGASVIGTYREASETTWTTFMTLSSSQASYPSAPELDGYKLFRLQCNSSVSYNQLLKYSLRFVLNGYGTRHIVDCQFFKQILIDNADGTKRLVVPDLSSAITDVIKVKYYFFRQDYADYMDTVTCLEDLYFTGSCYKDELALNGYESLVDDTHEKITTVTGSESNYFNLIQDVCETFECWAKFLIEHDRYGRIIYNYQLTEDTEPLAGKHYYKLRSPQPSSYDVDDEKYRLVNEDTFYTQVSASATYSRTTTYYSKLADGVYVSADLGYQFTGFQTNYYYCVYTDGVRTFVQCTSTSTYDNTIDYYILSRGQYQAVTISDDFHDDPTQYYLLNNNPSATLATGKEYFDQTTTYEKVYHKFVALKEYVGRENQAGFKYGVNLNNIVRTVKSDAICTKLYVKDIQEELAENELCSIQDASGNTSGETSLYNFQYYVNNGLLAQEALNRDLYGDQYGTGIAFITKLNDWNSATRASIELQSQLLITIAKIESQKTTYENLIASAQDTYDKEVKKIMTSANKTEAEAKVLKLDTTSQDDYVQSAIIARDAAYDKITTNQPIALNFENQLAKYNKKYAAVTKKVTNNSSRKMELVTTFFKKYSQFIHEGTWTGEGYYDADMYYSDALKVSYVSAFPKIEYQLSAIELSQLDGYENYNFQVGDKTYIEDTEFFGKVWQTGRPYQEEVIVSEIKYCLDNPSSNTITIQNYKTQFEDLFQRVAATSSSYEINKNAYSAAATLATDASVSEYLVNRILKENSAVISNAGSQTVSLDENGLTITDALNPNLMIRAVGGGIVLTTDGGNTWHTGITADGFNADTLKTGTIDTSMITIWNEGYNTFQWNPNGLMAYMHDDDSSGRAVQLYANKFVRFDENGIYGSSGWGDETQCNILNSHPSLATIQQYAVFSLTWKGFTLQTPEAGNWIKITSESTDTASYPLYTFTEYEGETLEPGVTYYIKKVNDRGTYYMRVSDTTKQTGRTYYTRSVDSATHKTLISAGTGNLSNNKVTNFRLLDDGSIICNNGVFNGIVCATDIIDAEGNSMLIDGQWATDYTGKAIAVFG